MKDRKSSLVGLLLGIAGLGLMFLQGLVEDKKTERMIEEKIDEALAERAEEES